MWCVALITCTLVCASRAYLPLPSYIKPCALKDPNINECAVKHGNNAIPFLVKGDRKYKVPVLIPLELPEVKIAEGDTRHVGLTFTLKNSKVHGLQDGRLEKANLDFDKKHNTFEIRIPRVEIIGQYEMAGRILLLPISGNGHINITCDDLYVVFDEDYRLVPRNGTRYFDNYNHTAKMEPSGVHINVTNLFGGDNILGKQMNVFLNENWREVFQELKIATIIADITASTAYGIHTSVAFDNIFPETVPS